MNTAAAGVSQPVIAQRLWLASSSAARNADCPRRPGIPKAGIVVVLRVPAVDGGQTEEVTGPIAVCRPVKTRAATIGAATTLQQSDGRGLRQADGLSECLNTPDTRPGQPST
jgi:hypothetical protein